MWKSTLDEECGHLCCMQRNKFCEFDCSRQSYHYIPALTKVLHNSIKLIWHVLF